MATPKPKRTRRQPVDPPYNDFFPLKEVPPKPDKLAQKRIKRTKEAILSALNGIMTVPKPKPTANPLPDAPQFPPPGQVFEPNGRGLVPFKGDKEYEQYLKELAPIEELRTALAVAGGEKALNFLADIIRYSKPSKTKPPTLAILAKRNGLALDQITEIWRNYSNVRGMTKIFSAAPKFADSVLSAASPTTVICPHCGGEGMMDRRPPRLGAECPACFGAKRITKVIKTALGDEQPIDLDCPTCQTPTSVKCLQCAGIGTIERPGDPAHAKMLFETVGWIKSKSSSVTVNLNSASHQVNSILDEIDRDLPAIDALYSREP